MNRREVFGAVAKTAACTAVLPAVALAGSDQDCSSALQRASGEKDFIANWLSDLLDGMSGQLDRDAQVKLIESCGRGCFRRHAFKRQIAADGCGSVEKLVDAYNRNFEAWVEDDGVHVRYGEVSKRCYCPVANTRASQPNDLHCECTKATHAAIFTEALGRDVRVDIVETLRRGGRTCHFVARV